MIYLDNNATTMVAPEVRDRMVPYFSEDYGNPSSLYAFGTKIRRVIEEARGEVAHLLGARTEREIVFTSGGTESNLTAIRSALKANPDHKRIVISQVEHPSVRNFCHGLRQEGYEVISIGVSKTGALDWEVLEHALTNQVAVVSIMWANNETGVLFPMEQISETVKRKGIALHVDTVQAIGKIPVNLAQIPVDFISLSAHKFHGPKGVGVLYVREGAPFFSLLVGGHQERGRRAGTENVPGIVGLAYALGMAVSVIEREMPRVESLRDRLERTLLAQIPESFVSGRQEPRLPNTTNVTIPGVEAEALLIRLSDAGVAASSGSACRTGALEPSHVLKAMGLPEEHAFSSLRFSLSRYTTSEEIDSALDIIVNIVHELRELNQAKKG